MSRDPSDRLYLICVHAECRSLANEIEPKLYLQGPLAQENDAFDAPEGSQFDPNPLAFDDVWT